MAGLSKQHFEKIANIINKGSYYNKEKELYLLNVSVYCLVEDLADYFKTQNPLFNENRFKKACLE